MEFSRGGEDPAVKCEEVDVEGRGVREWHGDLT